MFTSHNVPSPSLFGKGSSVVAVLEIAKMQALDAFWPLLDLSNHDVDVRTKLKKNLEMLVELNWFST